MMQRYLVGGSFSKPVRPDMPALLADTLNARDSVRGRPDTRGFTLLSWGDPATCVETKVRGRVQLEELCDAQKREHPQDLVPVGYKFQRDISMVRASCSCVSLPSFAHFSTPFRRCCCPSNSSIPTITTEPFDCPTCICPMA
jgi:hypothetical protein